MEDSIRIITTQTTMTEEEAKTQLELFDNDYIKVIHNHYKIKPKDTETRSLNQEIYCQIRNKLRLTKPVNSIHCEADSKKS